MHSCVVVKKFLITVCWNSLDDGRNFNYFTQHIFTEHLLYSKHCSRCWEFTSEEKKQKFMSSWDRSVMDKYGLYALDSEYREMRKTNQGS